MQLLKVNNNPVQRNISNVFDELFNEFPAFSGKEWSSNWNFPPVNIHETANAAPKKILRSMLKMVCLPSALKRKKKQSKKTIRPSGVSFLTAALNAVSIWMTPLMLTISRVNMKMVC